MSLGSGLAVMISVDVDSDVALRTQIPRFQHSKLKKSEFSELVPMFRNSARFPIVLEKVRFLLSTKECSKVEIVCAGH